MGFVKGSRPMCPRDQHCSQWAWKYVKYCICGAKDGVSLTLGLISVISWGVAEIPQIITNYKQKSTHGLSIAFLMTWIAGDLLNLFGCMLEPATLPTQHYMAMLFLVTTLVLATQAIYYGHIYHHLKSNRRCHKNEAAENKKQSSNDVGEKQVGSSDGWGTVSNYFASGTAPSSPIPFPALARRSSLAREVYYTSARSLSRSQTPTVGFQVQTRTISVYDQNSIEEPLLGAHVSTRSAPPSNVKTMLCVASVMTFVVCTFNLQLLEINSINTVFEKPNRGVVMQVGRKLFHVEERVDGGLFQETEGTENNEIGAYLGWGMAAIYLGGRLPQICLNIRRGNVEGLNPLMFIFALVGNATYVASILVSSLDWSKIRPNLPWLVDAGGCVILDTFILIQFIYFRNRTPKDLEIKHRNSNDT